MPVEITGQKAEVVVGEKIELGVKYTKEFGVLKSVEWTVPGTIVKGYTDGSSSATVTQIQPADKKASKLTFYWVDGGDGRKVEAKCVFTSKGTDSDKTISATFDVKRPECDFTSKTGTVAVGNPGFPGAGDELHFGTTATPGISWEGKVTTPSVGKGSIKDVQTIIMDRRRTTDPGNVKKKATSNGNWELDVSNPYSSTIALAASATKTLKSSDTPGSGLSSGNKETSASDQFRVWMMYKPDLPGSIWVPLKRIEWFWKGKATKGSGGTWSLVAGSASSASNPTGADTTEFPEFSRNVTSSKAWVNA